MREVLEPLANLPGVRTAVLVTNDGVPIAVQGVASLVRPEAEAPRRDGESRDWIDSAEDLNALAGLGTSWLSEVTRAVAPLSWSPPRYMVLQAARGTLAMMQAPNAILLLLLDRGMGGEELRLPMEGAIARMQRMLRGAARKEGQSEEPPGIFPAKRASPGSGASADRETGVPGKR